MERLNRYRPISAHSRFASRYRSTRDGKITIVTIFALLGLIVMAGFIGNVGQVVANKVAAQNAADAVAFSSAQWMARGMNAVTATNHMLGEVTALSVVIEGLGGPETDAGMQLYTPQNIALDSVNKVLKNLAPAGKDTPGMYAEQALGEAEQPFLDLLTKQMVPESDEDGKSKAWATIYDSKLELKLSLSKYLLVKTVANLGFYVPPPWGYISAAIAYAAHLTADAHLLEIGKEWFILQGLEFVVRQEPVKKLKSTMDTYIVPALAAHGDFIAGRLSKQSKSKPQAGSGIVNIAVGDELLHLGEVYHTKGFTYPVADKFLLPIEAEPGPSMKGTPRNQDEPEWGKDEVVTLPGADNTLKKIQDNIEDSKDSIQERMQHLRERLQLLDRLEADVNRLSQADGVTADERKSFDDEKREIERARQQMQQRLHDLEEQMRKLQNKQTQLNQTLKQLKDIGKQSGNLSAMRTHLALENRRGDPQMSEKEERFTQWVRATYPYVDAFRAPIIEQFHEWIPESEAEKHYEKWTNRYTLTKSWQFRSGYRFTPVGDTDAEWQKKKNPLAMYVMQGAYAKEPIAANGRMDRKGHEPWTEATTAGKSLAEKMFTIIGLTHRDIKPLFSPVIYPSGSEHGATTFAQAIFYNANEQQPPDIGTNSKTQAKVGWDTLNWDPSTNVPEWGTKLATSSAKWPWQIFSPSETLSSSAKVKLNWQAKLMPVTKTRLRGAVTMPMSVDMNANVAEAYALFDKMVTH